MKRKGIFKIISERAVKERLPFSVQQRRLQKRFRPGTAAENWRDLADYAAKLKASRYEVQLRQRL